jgi:hypothetical protein
VRQCLQFLLDLWSCGVFSDGNDSPVACSPVPAVALSGHGRGRGRSDARPSSQLARTFGASTQRAASGARAGQATPHPTPPQRALFARPPGPAQPPPRSEGARAARQRSG